MKKIFLTLLALCMLIMTGCQNNNAELNNDNENVREEKVDIIKINDGIKIKFDADGDGTQDEVLYQVIKLEDQFEQFGMLSVNNCTYKFDAISAMDACYAVKLNNKENFYTFALCDAGPSSDYSTTFVVFNNEGYDDRGQVEGVYENDEFDMNSGLRFNGDGSIITSVRSNLLQTWWYDAKFVLNRNDLFEIVKEDFYKTDYDTELLVDYEFYKEPKDNAEKTLVRSETMLKLIGTDEKNWIKASYVDLYGNETVGYFKVNGFFMDEECEVFPSEIFKNLCYAD